ncbi:MAG: EthD family reductase [Sciscionella sp.]
MTAKLTVLYGQPEDPQAFEAYYSDKHMPLARAIPGLQRIEVGKVLGAADGGPAPYYRIAELVFADVATLQASMSTEEGKAAGGDTANFATGGVTMFVSQND